MTTVESLEQVVSNLLPQELAEFRRWFAEFDAASNKSATSAAKPFAKAQIANTQAVKLADLCGGLENSATFSANPVDIQRKLRDEWR